MTTSKTTPLEQIGKLLTEKLINKTPLEVINILATELSKYKECNAELWGGILRRDRKIAMLEDALFQACTQKRRL